MEKIKSDIKFTEITLSIIASKYKLAPSTISEINFGNSEKTEKIKEMINKGKSDEEICNSLGIGKGEVLLIRELIK